MTTTNPPRKRPNRLSKASWALIEQVRKCGDVMNPLTGSAVRATQDDAIESMYNAWCLENQEKRPKAGSK